MGKRSHKRFRGCICRSSQMAGNGRTHKKCRFCKGQEVLLQDTPIGCVCKKDQCLEQALELLRQRFPDLNLPVIRSGDLRPQASMRMLHSLRGQLMRLVRNDEPVGEEFVKKVSALIDFILLYAKRAGRNFGLEVVQVCRQAAVEEERAKQIIQQLGEFANAA